MARGGSTRLAYRLGVILMILELAHVPLPFPEHRSAAPECSPCPAPGIEWHWVASTPGAIDEDDEIEVAATCDDGTCPGVCDPGRCPHMVAPHRARMHHFVRGHSSKGLGKVFAERSTFLGLVDGVAKGPHTATNDLAHKPRAAMLQRWLC